MKVCYHTTFKDLKLSGVQKNFRNSIGPRSENWRILINKEIHAVVKKPTITETIRLNRLHWFGHVQRGWKKTEFPKKYYI